MPNQYHTWRRPDTASLPSLQQWWLNLCFLHTRPNAERLGAITSAKSTEYFEICFVPLVPFSSKHIWLCRICNWSAPVQQGCVIYLNEFFTAAPAMVTVADGNLCLCLNLVIMLLNHLQILIGPKIQDRNSGPFVVSSLMYTKSNLCTYKYADPASHVPGELALTQPIFVLSHHDYQRISKHSSL